MTIPTPRIAITGQPAAYQAMMGLESYLAATNLPRTLLHLVKLRASQLNGCSFCVDMHSHEAWTDGESLERLSGVAAWRESPYFTDAERAALDLTEAVTRLSPEGVPDAVWDAAAAHFDEDGLAALLMAIVTINAWNRLNVAVRNVPKPRTATRAATDPAAHAAP